MAVPLAEPSRAVPGAPVLDAAEAAAIRADPQALAGLRAGLERMTRFYAETDGWLTGFDHNHLRISRIIAATRDLLGQQAAAAFHQAVTARTGPRAPRSTMTACAIGIGRSALRRLGFSAPPRRARAGRDFPAGGRGCCPHSAGSRRRYAG